VVALTSATHEPDGGDPGLVEDLLRALPDDPQPDLLKLGQTLAHHGSVTVRRAVASRLPEVVGPTARPLLRVACRDPDESVRIAAIGALRRMGAVDAAVVALARDLLTVDTQASLELRTAVASALQNVMAEHRQEAIEVLKEGLRPRARSIMGVLRGTVGGHDEGAVLETIARSLMAIAPDEGREEIARRAALSKGEVRERLERMLIR
jgi:HEAT repeat protein